MNRGNLIDTADVYSVWAPNNAGGVSEEIIGRWLKATGNRDRVLVATKVRGAMGQNFSEGDDHPLQREGLSRRLVGCVSGFIGPVRPIGPIGLGLRESRARNADDSPTLAPAFRRLPRTGKGSASAICLGWSLPNVEMPGRRRLDLRIRVSKRSRSVRNSCS
jgi:hypothetical protein